MKTEHILIIRFSALGDIAMTVPVVDALARQYPDLRITVLSRAVARPLFDRLPSNVSFMEADVRKEYHGVKGLNALYRRLAAKHFTAVADFHNVLRANYLRMRFNIDHYRVAHINKHRNGRKRLTAVSDKLLVQQPTSFRNYMDVLEKLGYPVKPDFKTIFAEGGNDLSLLPDTFNVQREPRQRWIGIAPFAAHEGKIYPLRLMERVIVLLGERFPSCRIMLFGGGRKENIVLNDWAEKYPHCENASAALGSLSLELVLMSHLDVMLSMDSANMHLASIVGTPVVSIWGATHPFAGFMGWGQPPENAVQLDLPCRPCSIYGNKPCLRGDYSCLKNISPDQVVDRIAATWK